MWTPDYYVRYVKLPRKIDSLVIPNDDGTFDIYINSEHTEERQKYWLEHELEHIRQDHFYLETVNIVNVEKQANGEKTELPDIFDNPVRRYIPEFASLGSFKKYMYALRDKYQKERAV